MNVCCGRQDQPSPTFRVRGRFFCRVRTQGPVTQSSPCRRQCLSTTHEAMTSGSGPQRRTSFSEVPGTAAEQDCAQQLASLLMRMGGLGLRSAVRCARAAYWASWAYALPMIEERNPAIAEMVEHTLANGARSEHGCLSELSRAVSDLDQQGFAWRPSWSELRRSKRPPENLSKEPSEWQHGWQYWSSSVADTSLRKSSMLSGQTAANLGTPSFPFRSQRWGRVGLRSHSSQVRDSSAPFSASCCWSAGACHCPSRTPHAVGAMPGSIQRTPGQAESANAPIPLNARWHACFEKRALECGSTSSSAT